VLLPSIAVKTALTKKNDRPKSKLPDAALEPAKASDAALPLASSTAALMTLKLTVLEVPFAPRFIAESFSGVAGQ
jgi:hypothetical protein